MKNLFRFCVMINVMFFLFGFIAIGTNTIIIDSYTISGVSHELKFDFNNIIIALVSVIIVIALVGIQVLGSGLADNSVRLIIRILSYVLLWSVISVFSVEIITLIPYGIGGSIYTILTILYAISFLTTIAESEV